MTNEELMDKVHDALEEVILNVREDHKEQLGELHIAIEELKKAFQDLKDTVATEIKQSKLIEILNKLL